MTRNTRIPVTVKQASQIRDPAHFRDHFSGHADLYSQFRPRYPEALYQWLASLVPSDTRVWDCATGNGQAAVALAKYFHRIDATDASRTQIDAAQPHGRVHYAVRPASDSGLETNSVGLVTVAQAMHWFEPEPFVREVSRVLAPEGVAVAWCYELFEVCVGFDDPMLELYHQVLGADWPKERHHIESGYRHWPWPWPKLPTPDFQMTAEWTVDQALGYLRTWSASRRWQAREGRDPVTMMEPALRKGWGDAPSRTVRWPLVVLASTVG